MEIQLRQLKKECWKDALELQVHPSQWKFVPTVDASLAKINTKPDGEYVKYIPFGVYNHESLVGFMMHAYDEESISMYWINGFIIDYHYQGKGFGKQALLKMINWISKTFPQCEEIRLTVHKENEAARKLYERVGFLPTGMVSGEEDIWNLTVR